MTTNPPNAPAAAHTPDNDESCNELALEFESTILSTLPLDSMTCAGFVDGELEAFNSRFNV